MDSCPINSKCTKWNTFDIGHCETVDGCPYDLTCPFCGGSVYLQVCDAEGNFHPDEYAENPWSGLGYVIVHTIEQANGECPIATFKDETIGTQIYDSRDEVIRIWNIRRYIR